MNLFDPRAMVWRKPGQGLGFGFTAKGSHEATGGSVSHFMAAIAYRKGVIATDHYFRRINADTVSSFVHEYFASMFKVCPNPKEELFLQDRNPSQNSWKVRSAWNKIGAPKFSNPARST